MSSKKFITKTVPFRFSGIDLKFNLSQGLFSSFEVDKGSQLLLKSLAQKWTPPESGKVADLGCGVGVLGLSLIKKWPGLTLESVDRDALAIAFTKMNAVLNDLEVTTRVELGLENPEGEYDLVISNLPAKAGNQVLSHFLDQMSWKLRPQGLIAVVIVTPLADWLQETIVKLGGEVLHREETTQHRVLHFTLPKRPPAADLDPYLRTQTKIKRPGVFFDLKSVYGLPNFDSLDFELELGLGIIKTWEPSSGPTLFWNPGQGHLPLGLGKKLKNHKVVLAGRDILALRISQNNLTACGPLDISLEPTATWDDLGEMQLPNIQQIIAIWEKTPQVKEEETFWKTLDKITGPKAKVLIIAKSHDIQEFLKTKRGWPLLISPKHKGYRALVLKKS